MAVVGNVVVENVAVGVAVEVGNVVAAVAVVAVVAVVPWFLLSFLSA